MAPFMFYLLLTKDFAKAAAPYKDFYVSLKIQIVKAVLA